MTVWNASTGLVIRLAPDPSILEPTAMMQVTPQMRIILVVEPLDFRKGIDCR